MKIFVPGRLCLFGEHSDWAGSYRCYNPQLEKGYALIVGTNQGLYVQVKPHPTDLILQTTLNDGSRKTLILPIQQETLLNTAKIGDFFSYAAGVAYQIKQKYDVGGIEIDNYLTDLPIQKGLSSSAAICVLVARAFNQTYQLNMNRLEEMEIAYLGERMTPSQCGRMDQACAYGDRPIAMKFDSDSTQVIELKVPKDLFLVIVDLAAQKNTQKILQHLNAAYPFPQTEQHQNVQKYLGEISYQITQAAIDALQTGNAEKIGYLMQHAQIQFDKYLIPACPEELTAPILHQLLNHPPIQKYIWGGKGVGSQGDGTAQFIVKNAEYQDKIIEIINRDFPQMQCLKLTIYADKTS